MEHLKTSARSVTMARSTRSALQGVPARFTRRCLVHLRFPRMLDRPFPNRFQQIPMFCQYILQISCSDRSSHATLLSGHLVLSLPSAAN